MVRSKSDESLEQFKLLLDAVEPAYTPSTAELVEEVDRVMANWRQYPYLLAEVEDAAEALGKDPLVYAQEIDAYWAKRRGELPGG